MVRRAANLGHLDTVPPRYLHTAPWAAGPPEPELEEPMDPRPCTRPDGGCDEPVIFVESATTGRKMCLNAEPEKRVVLVRSNDQQVIYRATPGSAPPAARIIDVRTDHHATCAKWLAQLERERAAKAGRG